MINLQEYIDEKLDSMDYEFRISREHMNAESDIVRDFIDEKFDKNDPDFVNSRNQDLYDLAWEFGDEHADIHYDALMEWFNSPDHDGVYHFENVIKEGLVKTGRDFDFHQTVQVAQVDEAIDAINFAYDSGVLAPVIAATFMQSQGYEKANEELLDKMGELMSNDMYAYRLSNEGLEKAMSDAKAELGLKDNEIGEKTNDKNKNKDKDER